MTYKITGLTPAAHAPLFAMSDAELAAINARRVTAAASEWGAGKDGQAREIVIRLAPSMP